MCKEYFDRSNEHRRHKGVQAIIRNMETVAEYSLVIIKVALCNRALGSVGNLSKDVFERRTLTGSEAFSLCICLDSNKCALLSFFSLIMTIYPRVSTKPLSNDANSPLPVDVRRSKTLLGSLSKDVFERRTSTGSEVFSLYICLDSNRFVLLSFFSLIKTIYQRVSTKPMSSDANSPFPVEVCRLKTLLLKLSIDFRE